MSNTSDIEPGFIFLALVCPQHCPLFTSVLLACFGPGPLFTALLFLCWVPSLLSGGLKRQILSFRIPLGHRYMIVALQNTTQRCLEFTATAVIEYFMGCLLSSSPQGAG